MPENVVIFIGGVPCVGKTSIAGFMARELGISIVLSGDYLREFIRPIVGAEEKYSTLFVSVYNAWKQFGEMSDENIIKGYRAQSYFMSKGINSLIERANKNGETLVIESLYFCPDELDALKHKNVVKLYIYNLDRESYRKMILEREQYTHTKSSGNRLAENIYQYTRIMEYTLRLCEQYGIKTFDSSNYLKAREDILKYVKKSIA